MSAEVTMGVCEHCGDPLGFGAHCCRNYADDGRPVGCYLRTEKRLKAQLADAEQRAVERWKSANGYEDLLRAYSGALTATETAFERGREAERAEVVAYLRESGEVPVAQDIASGQHLARGSR